MHTSSWRQCHLTGKWSRYFQNEDLVQTFQRSYSQLIYFVELDGETISLITAPTAVLSGFLIPLIITYAFCKPLPPEAKLVVWTCVQEIDNPLEPWPEVLTRLVYFNLRTSQILHIIIVVNKNGIGIWWQNIFKTDCYLDKQIYVFRHVWVRRSRHSRKWGELWRPWGNSLSVLSSSMWRCPTVSGKY